jgi:nucleoporin NUP82
MGMYGHFVRFCRSAGKWIWFHAASVLILCSSIPATYVAALTIFLQEKANLLQADLAQSKHSHSDTPRDPSSRETHIRRLAAQRRFADILESQITVLKDAGSSPEHLPSGDAYTITLPKTKYLNDGKSVKRQGPFLFKPAPEELKLSAETGPRVEGVASDIIVMSGTGAASRAHDAKGKSKESTSSSGIGVVAIAWKDGRVDVCLEVAKVEALWVEEVVSLAKNLGEAR